MLETLNPMNLDPNTFYFLMTLHGIIGTTAAIIAQQKGHNFGLWIIIGLIGGTPALIASLLIKRKEQQI